MIYSFFFRFENSSTCAYIIFTFLIYIHPSIYPFRSEEKIAATFTTIKINSIFRITIWVFYFFT